MKSKENNAKFKAKTTKVNTKNEKTKNKRGITLISLIVTIIVLLLLTGIPIVMMVGENGIIQKSHEAKAQVEQAEEQKELDLKLSEYVLEKETTDIEIDDFVERLEKEGKVKSHTQNDDGSYDVETDSGYSAEIKPDIDNPGDTVTNVEGKKDELPPKITTFELSSTTNSIKVKLKVNTRKKKTTIKWYYKEKGDEEYEEIVACAAEPTGTPEVYENTYTIQNLIQTTEYDIKIETTNDMGTTTEEKSIETKQVPSGKDDEEGIEFSNLKWSDKTHKASIDVNKLNKTTEYEIRYRIGNSPDEKIFEGLGKEGGKIEDLELNNVVYARLWDGTNYGEAATITITDKKEPIIVLAKTNATTSEITTHVTVRDLEAGLPNEVEFKYYIKLKNEPESSYKEEIKQVPNAENTKGEGGTRTEDNNTFEGLKQNTVYNIKVEITDIAGNKGVKTITVKTPIIPGTAGGNNTNGKDTDKDGKIDAWDTNGDGKLDAWDTNKDGNADSFDKDGDGNLSDEENSSKNPEKNNNGRDENGGKDTNGDGVVDTWDTDGDGKDDAKDTDGDGNADKWLDPKTGEWTDGKGNDPEPQDTTGDGKPDRWVDPETGEDKAIDTNGDGKADKWFDEDKNEWTDTDENGHKQWDTDGDGVPDAKDEDGDNNADKWKDPNTGNWNGEDGKDKNGGKDTNGDGRPDKWVDENGNEVGKDTDGDGKADKWVDPETGEYPDEEEPEKYPKAKDTNGDGRPDTWVDEEGHEIAKDTDGDGKADKFVNPETGEFPNPNEPEKYPKPQDKNGDGIPDTWIDEEGNEVARDTSEPPGGKADEWKDPDDPESSWKNTDKDNHTQWDTDGDGKPDAKDTTGDGNADMWIDPNNPEDEWKNAEQSGKGNGKDTNQDGKVDAWDTDNNGENDSWDTDGDEKADSFDKNGNGILDDNEDASKYPELNGRDKNGGKDTTGNGKPDTWDRNGDGKDDSWDTDGDGNADSFDENGNGELDDDENSTKTPSNNGKDENGGKDTNKDGKPDTWYGENEKVVGKDTNGDGKADEFIDPETQDPNGEGNLSGKDRNENKLFDTDGDGKPDARDTNNDGKADEWKDPETGEWKSSNELPGKPKDTDSDGIPDEWDFNEDNKTDAWDKNGDGKPDQWDTNKDGNVDAWDTDGDGMPDSYDTTKDGSADTWVPSAKEGSIEFTYKPTGWTKEEVEVTLSSEHTKNGFTIEYSKDYDSLTRKGHWETGTKVTLEENGPIYARLKSTKNDETGGIIKGEVNKIDKVAPIVTVKTLEETTNSITVETNVEDKASGLPEPVTYNYYIKEQNQPDGEYRLSGTKKVARRSDIKTSTDTYTYEKLGQTKTYDIKVTVEDAVTNMGQNTTTGTTETMPDANDQSNGLSFGQIEWNATTHKASITVNKINTNTSYKIRYKVGSKLTVEDYDNEFDSSGKIDNLELEQTVYASLWDGTNYGNSATITIDEDVPPKVNSAQQETTDWKNENKRIKVTATDNESGIAAYAITSENSKPNKDSGDWNESDASEWTSTDTYDNGEYYVWVKDKADNISTEGVKVIVDNIETTAPTITVDSSAEPKKSQTATITIKDTGNSGFVAGQYIIKYEWSLSESKPALIKEASIEVQDGAKEGVTTVELNEGTGNYKLYVQGQNLTDKAGNSDSPEAVGTFELDNLPPKISISPAEGNKNWAKTQMATIKVEEVGKAGSNASSYKYVWQQNNSAPDENSELYTTQYTSETPVTLSEKTGSDWYIAAIAKDSLGNTATKIAGPFYIDNANPDTAKPALLPTTNSLTVTFNQADNNSGINESTIKYYYKLETENEWKQWTDGTGRKSTTITGLKLNSKYQVKTNVQDKATNGIDSAIAEITTQNILQPQISVSPTSNQGYTNGEVTVTITYRTTGTGLTNQYKIDSSGDWNKYDKQFNVNKNCTIYARTIDSTNQGSDLERQATLTIDHIDTQKPTVTGTKVENGETWTTTNKKITITANDTGVSGIAAYAITKSDVTTAPDASSSEWNKSESPTWTSEKDYPSGTYNAWVMDKAKNVSEKGYSVIIGHIDAAPPTISNVEQLPAGWSKTNKQIKVTASDNGGCGIGAYAITNSGVNIAPDTNSNEWNASEGTSWTSTKTYPEGTYNVWVRDGLKNVIKNPSTITITQVDTKIPQVTVTSGNTTVAKTQTAKITITDEGSGFQTTSYKVKYQWSQDAATPSTYSDETTITTNVGAKSASADVTLNGGTGTYNIYVQAQSLTDQAGNNVSPTAKETSFIVDNSGPEISFGTPSSNTYKKSQSTTVTVKEVGLATANNSTWKYKWLTGDTKPAAPGDDKSYDQSYASGRASISNGTGQNYYLAVMAKDSLENVTRTVTGPFWLDNTAPNETKPTLTPTATDTLSLTFNQSDANVGIDTSTKKYQYKKTTESIWSDWKPIPIDNNNVSIGKLSSGVEYEVKTQVDDTLKNGVVSSDIARATTRAITEPTIQLSDSNATNKSITATISFPTTGIGLTNEYQIDNGGWNKVSESSKQVTIENNCTIKARTKDASNNEKTKTLVVTNIDKGNPNQATITLNPETAKVGETIKAKVVQSDNNGGKGLSIANCKWVYNTTAENLGTDNTGAYTEKFNNESEEINLIAPSAGSYYLHVLSVDTVGNKTETKKGPITINKKAETAKELANQVNGQDETGKSSIIGKEVTGVATSSLQEEYGWQIFDVDSDHIYLIAKNYVHNKDCPESKSGRTVWVSSGQDYSVNLNYVSEDYYNGTGNITDEMMKKLNNDYFYNNNYSNSGSHWREVAYLLDKSIWTTKYTGDSSGNKQIEYVIGSPTIEQIIKAYNKKYKKNYSAKATSEWGYRVSDTGAEPYKIDISGMFNSSDTAFVISERSRADTLIVSTPYDFGSTGDQMLLKFDGSIKCYANEHYYSKTYGIRPIICLKSNVVLEKQENGSYKIVSPAAEIGTAADLANQVKGEDETGKGSIIGKEVTGVATSSLQEEYGWQIFDVDSDHIYLIAKNYVHNKDCPESKSGRTVWVSSGQDYSVNLNYVSEDYYNGTGNITDEMMKKLNNDYFYNNNYSNSGSHWREVAYLLDKSIWTTKYTGDSSGNKQIEYVIGSPTIEQIIKAYNKKYKKNYSAKATSEWGYRVSDTGAEPYKIDISGMFNSSDTAFVISERSRADTLIVSTPYDFGSTGDQMLLKFDGSIKCYANEHYYSKTYGIRPIICLKSNVVLEKQEDGNYKIW